MNLRVRMRKKLSSTCYHMKDMYTVCIHTMYIVYSHICVYIYRIWLYIYDIYRMIHYISYVVYSQIMLNMLDIIARCTAEVLDEADLAVRLVQFIPIVQELHLNVSLLNESYCLRTFYTT